MLHKRFEELKLSGHLPSPSGVGLAILHETQTETAGIEELIRILQTDPALTGRLLKLANSARLGGAEPAKTVSQAALRLGTRAVRSVALGFTLVSSNRSGVCPRFDYDRYWSFSLASAVAAQALSRRLKVCDPAEAFTCGLLSRIGMLALASVHPEAYSQILDENDVEDDARLLAAETRAFDINHWEVTASMMAEWGLPKSFTSAILTLAKADVSDPGGDEALLRMRRLLAAANRVADLLLRDLDIVKADPERAAREIESVRKDLPLDQEQATLLCEQSNREWREWSELFRIPTLSDSGLNTIEALQGTPAPASEEVLPPAESAAHGATVETLEAGEPAPRTRRLKVLVVDDDARLLRLISLHLVRAGYEVITASNGREGLELALAETPEIVVTDWMMPEMSGIELCRSLRRIESGRRTYVLILTAREDEDRIVDAFGAGADDYVTKPFNPRIFLARVQAGHRLVDLQHQVEADKHVRSAQVAEMGLLTRKLRTAAMTDVLTELPNRRHALSRLAHEWSASVTLDRPLSLVLIDIDHFKKVNDVHGHDVGDAVLKDTARMLRARTRRGDVVCRLGGEEFLVINVNCDLAAALICAERLRSAVEKNRIVHTGFDGNVTISLGVVERTPATRDVDELLRAGDQAVYLAKAAGRNTIRSALPPESGLPRAG